MELRAAPARETPAPLAVLVPSLATVVGAAWAFTIFPPLALLVIGAGLWPTALGGRSTYGARVSLVAAACTVLTCPVAFFLWWAVCINTSICGKDIGIVWTVLACFLGAIVFFGLGSFGVRTYRATSIMPPALLAGVLAMLAVLAVAPGAPGFCET